MGCSRPTSPTIIKRRISAISTLTSQLTFKVLRSHLRRPLCHPLCHPFRRSPRPTPRPFSSNYVGSLQATFSGYDTLARRFSSYPQPLNLFALPSWQKATDYKEYVDIHDLSDISDLELSNYDVLITDLNEKTLRSEISKVFGIDYLAKATEDDAKREVDAINGYLYGDGRRPMVPCVVSNGNKAYWVHFLVGTGAPGTFVSKKVNAPAMQRVYSVANLILGVRCSRPQDRCHRFYHHCWLMELQLRKKNTSLHV